MCNMNENHKQLILCPIFEVVLILIVLRESNIGKLRDKQQSKKALFSIMRRHDAYGFDGSIISI